MSSSCHCPCEISWLTYWAFSKKTSKKSPDKKSLLKRYSKSDANKPPAVMQTYFECVGKFLMRKPYLPYFSNCRIFWKKFKNENIKKFMKKTLKLCNDFKSSENLEVYSKI
uniref:(northern house mosquito) hypothetical protein n=1 Tax=Culex pipiens TaxID=7175 RepID=A0A8D8K8X2_CULPI